jgi:mRNA-degrading endonuclease toxin of MazEF toxin-antitoxin module
MSRAKSERTQLLIRIATADGAQSGLLFDSAVQCENLVTIDTQFVIRKIGILPAATMREVDECLKASLGL